MRIVLGSLLAVGMSAALAQSGGTQFSQAEIARLAELDPAQRRAELRAMDPDERRGLWFAVMSKLRSDRGISGPGRGSYRAAVPAGGNGSLALPSPTAPAGAAQQGQIQYDSGPFTITFGGGAIIGNRFNTADGQAIQNATVTAVQAVVVPGPANTTSSAGFVLLGPQTGGGGAMAIFSSFTAAAGATDTVDFSLNESVPGSYFVLFGDFAESYVPAFGPGTAQGQGRHGVVGYTGGMGPNITSTFDFGGNFNGFVRSSGNIVPVELLPGAD